MTVERNLSALLTPVCWRACFFFRAPASASVEISGCLRVDAALNQSRPTMALNAQDFRCGVSLAYLPGLALYSES
jgi:hypothetical protein